MLEDNRIFDFIESLYSLNKPQFLFANYVLKTFNEDYNRYHMIDGYEVSAALKEHFQCEITKDDISYTLDKLEHDLFFINKNYNNKSYKLTHNGKEVIQKHRELLVYFSSEIVDRLKEAQERQEELNTKQQIDNLTLKQLKGSIFQIKKWWLILLINAVLTIMVSIVIAYLIKNYGLS